MLAARCTLALVCLLAALAAASQPAVAARVAIGIGEQSPGMFDSPYWKRLGLRDARYVTPWDTLRDPVQLERLDRWMAAARAAHVRVLLGFAHSLRSQRLAHTLPTPARFAREFVGFRARYPDVHAWIVWSEANHPLALTWKRPRRAAQYFDVVASHCRGCNVVAADILDVNGMASWLDRFNRYARHRPTLWGLHNYGDANGFKTLGTRILLHHTRGRVWFTETGGVVLRRDYVGARVVRVHRYPVRHAAEATLHVLRLACLSPRIRRVYLYHWQAPLPVTSWDSGLLDPFGHPRLAYGVLARWLGRPRC